MRKDPILWKFSLKLSSTSLVPSSQGPESSALCSQISHVRQPLLFAQNQHPPESHTGHLAVHLPPQLVHHTSTVLRTSSSRVKSSWAVVSVGEGLGPAKRISLGAPTPCKKDQPMRKVSLTITHTSSPPFSTWSSSFIESPSPSSKKPPFNIPSSV